MLLMNYRVALQTFIDGGGSSNRFCVNDRHGFGTAMASLIVGATYGVARAEIGVVKVSASR